MVVIRLARRGAKKQPFYHITAADRRAPRDGRYIEKLGYYNPIARGKAQRLHVDLGRVDYWISVGAQVTKPTQRLLSEARIQAAQSIEPISNTEESVNTEIQSASEEAVVAEDLGATPSVDESTLEDEDPSADVGSESTATVQDSDNEKSNS